jgi:hypothetical protein
MTRTPRGEVREALRAFAGEDDFLELETEDLPPVPRFVACAPTLDCMETLVAGSAVRAMLERRPAGAWLYFCHTIAGVYQAFLRVLSHMIEMTLADMPEGGYDAIFTICNDPIPDDFQVERTGVPRRGNEQLEKVVANERRTAWVAFQHGLRYNWRGVGDCYRDLVLSGLANGRLKCVVTTSTLATGVNVAGVDHVCVHSCGATPNHELIQMIGRSARSGPGVALVYGVQPMMNVADADTLLPVAQAATAQIRIFAWLLLRMTPDLLSVDARRELTGSSGPHCTNDTTR